MATPHPWADATVTCYAALVADVKKPAYGLARRVPGGPAGATYDYFDRDSRTWKSHPDPLRIFTGIGGISDAVPVSPDAALRILRTLGGSTL